MSDVCDGDRPTAEEALRALSVVRNSFPCFPAVGCLNLRRDVARALDTIRAAIRPAESKPANVAACPGCNGAHRSSIAATACLVRELASARAQVALTEAEKAIVDACVAERAARDAIPRFEAKYVGDYPPPEFWDASNKLEAANVAYEKKLDELLTLRAQEKADG
jgi:hypothetical protein